MQILSIDQAIDELCFSETNDEFRTTKRKEAFQRADSGAIGFVSSDFDDWTVAEARTRFGEELILSAAYAGKLTLLARNANARPKDSVFLESVELVEVATETIRTGALDRAEGELVIVLPETEDGEESTELVDLHLYAEQFDAFFQDLRSFRRLQSCVEYGLQSYEKADAMAVTDTASEKPALNARAEFDCDRWFQQKLVTVSEDALQAKGAVLQEALQHFPNLSRRGFIRIWERRAPPHWKRAGRRPTPKS